VDLKLSEKSEQIMKRCVRCVLPETFPNIKFNEEGVCNFCQTYHYQNISEESKKDYQTKFEELIKKYSGKGEYDGIMAYSGGKDSTYSLKLLRERYGIKILALTFDNGFISHTAIQNIKNVVEHLGIDHIFYKPRFDLLAKIFRIAIENDIFSRKTLERASTVCTACIGLVKFTCLKFAIRNNIPFIFYGWSPGQAPIKASIFKNNISMIKSMQQALLVPLQKFIGEGINSYFLNENDFKLLEKLPYNLSPLAFLEYDEDKIHREIERLGWIFPADTDTNSTNCLLNALANQVHKQKFKYHPYVFEIANLVRQGFISRVDGLEKIETEEISENIEQVKLRLNI
jgi:hypothetical protein